MEQQPINQMPTLRPKNWLVESILITLFCCLPLGIVGIVNAAQVNSKYDSGDYVGAESASREAGKWVKYGFFGGLVVIVLYVLLVVVLGVGAASMKSFR